MNIHKKITNMGFKKCAFHKINMAVTSRDVGYSMILDDIEIKNVYINGKYTQTVNKKSHPKWDSFYCLEFSHNLMVWMYVEKQSVIKTIWLEGERVKHGVEIIYEHSSKSFQMNGKGDIIRLFPKDIQRDFILNSLFD